MFQRFLLCSGLAAAVNLAVGYVLYGILGMSGTLTFPLSVAIAFASGMGVSFALNRRFTYPSSGRPPRQELRDFLGVSLVGLALTTGIAFLLDQLAHDGLARIATALPGAVLPETLAHVVAVGLTAIYSFLAHKFISFRPQADRLPAAQQQS